MFIAPFQAGPMHARHCELRSIETFTLGMFWPNLLPHNRCNTGALAIWCFRVQRAMDFGVWERREAFLWLFESIKCFGWSDAEARFTWRKTEKVMTKAKILRRESLHHLSDVPLKTQPWTFFLTFHGLILYNVRAKQPDKMNETCSLSARYSVSYDIKIALNNCALFYRYVSF